MKQPGIIKITRDRACHCGSSIREKEHSSWSVRFKSTISSKLFAKKARLSRAFKYGGELIPGRRFSMCPRRFILVRRLYTKGETGEDRGRGWGFQSIREIESKSYGGERLSLELETKHSNKSRRNESTEGILINENKTEEKGISRLVLGRAPWAIDISNARARAQKESAVSFEYRGKKKLIRHQPAILAIYTEFFSHSTIW